MVQPSSEVAQSERPGYSRRGLLDVQAALLRMYGRGGLINIRNEASIRRRSTASATLFPSSRCRLTQNLADQLDSRNDAISLGLLAYHLSPGMYRLSPFNGHGLFRHQIVDGEAKNEMHRMITDKLLKMSCNAASVNACRLGRISIWLMYAAHAVAIATAILCIRAYAYSEGPQKKLGT